jgi:hypothetical protein
MAPRLARRDKVKRSRRGRECDMMWLARSWLKSSPSCRFIFIKHRRISTKGEAQSLVELINQRMV